MLKRHQNVNLSEATDVGAALFRHSGDWIWL